MTGASRPAHRVSVVGPVNMDLFLRGSAPPEPASLRAWVGPSQVELAVAGSIGYTVEVLARLGCRIEVHTTTGDDAFGDHIRRHLAAAGLGTSHVRTTAGDTAIAVYMLLFGGSKRPMTYRLPGFDPWPDPPRLLERDDGPPHLVHSGGLLHFPAMWHRGLADAFAAARAAGATTSIDPQFPLTDLPAPWLPHAADVLAQADVLLVDEGEARAIFGVGRPEDAIDAAHALGCRVVAVKRGPLGALASDGRELVVQPAVAVSDALVREAVGAGDAFDAGFLVALLDGRPLEEAARLATATAACSLSGRGGAEAVAGPERVASMLPRVPRATVRPRR